MSTRMQCMPGAISLVLTTLAVLNVTGAPQLACTTAARRVRVTEWGAERDLRRLGVTLKHERSPADTSTGTGTGLWPVTVTRRAGWLARGIVAQVDDCH
mmetsp:Transcript_16572/g.28421  ORF Transcript_16572/g.28421 Transcript_16572/m.28421 type:complete len:99 (-) Transcript_16572:79-375(-)